MHPTRKSRSPMVGFEAIPVPYALASIGMTAAYSNREYKISLCKQPITILGNELTAQKMLVSRLDNKPIKNHWAQLQKLKNHFWGPDVTAVEFYPSHDRLVDMANVYWLWTFPGLNAPQ